MMRISLKVRAAKEAIYELSPTFKLKNCPEHICNMHCCRSITDLDHRMTEFDCHCRVMRGGQCKRMAGGVSIRQTMTGMLPEIAGHLQLVPARSTSGHDLFYTVKDDILIVADVVLTPGANLEGSSRGR